MKKILFIVAAFVTTFASAQIKMPQASTTQKINQDFGMGAIELTYSRPNVKGRTVLKEKSELVDRVEYAAPGFINIFLTL